MASPAYRSSIPALSRHDPGQRRGDRIVTLPEGRGDRTRDTVSAWRWRSPATAFESEVETVPTWSAGACRPPR